MSEQIRRILVNGVVISLLALLLALAGTWWRMSTQFRLGEEAYRTGDFAGAVAGYESAIHMYIPYHPAIERSAERLWQIGENNEKLGDVNRALIAYRALRSSYYGTHWLITPGGNWIAKCDRRIAVLVPLQRDR